MTRDFDYYQDQGESITFTADTALLYGWCTRKPPKTAASQLPTPEDTPPLPKVKLALQPNPTPTNPEPELTSASTSLDPDAQEFAPTSEPRDRSAKPWWYFIDLRGRTVIGEWGLLEEIYAELTRGNATQHEEPRRSIRGGVWYCVLVPDEVRNIGSAYMLRYTRMVVKWYVRRFERLARRLERARGFESSSEEEVDEMYMFLDEDWDGDDDRMNGRGK